MDENIFDMREVFIFLNVMIEVYQNIILRSKKWENYFGKGI